MPYVSIKPIVDVTVRGLCCRAYEGHPKGCPNFMHASRCPPNAPLFSEVFNLDGPFFAIYSRFPLGEHVEAMRQAHPNWSYRQLSCVLYWQGTARKKLKTEIITFKTAHPQSWLIETTPEAFGCNVTETMRTVGIELPWPPREYAYHVAIAGLPCVS